MRDSFLVILVAIISCLQGNGASRCRLPQEVRGSWIRRPYGTMEVTSDAVRITYHSATTSQRCISQDGDRYLIASPGLSPKCTRFVMDGEEMRMQTLILFGTRDMTRLMTSWKRSCRNKEEPSSTTTFSRPTPGRPSCSLPQQLRGDWYRRPSGTLTVDRDSFRDSSIGNRRCLDQDGDHFLFVSYQLSSLCVRFLFEEDGTAKMETMQSYSTSYIDDLLTYWKRSCRAVVHPRYRTTYERPY